MKRPCYVFDGRCNMDDKALREIGFQVHSIGKPKPPPVEQQRLPRRDSANVNQLRASMESMGNTSVLDY